MSDKQHVYAVRVNWTGNEGDGTAAYNSYSRAHRISAAGKPDIQGSSDPSFRGDPARWNPEELLLASLSACHKLWYLGLCAQASITVTAYEDNAEGTMVEEPGGAGHFTRVVLPVLGSRRHKHAWKVAKSRSCFCDLQALIEMEPFRAHFPAPLSR